MSWERHISSPVYVLFAQNSISMKEKIDNIKISISKLSFIPPFLIRIVLAYGFYEPAMKKWNDIGAIAEWFGNEDWGLGLPFPTVNAYLAATTEILGVFLLLLGLGTRIISIPLIFTMLVAIFTVHFENGFAAGDNGFEIPLYYIIMLIVLIINGPGKLSLDHIIYKKLK